MRWRPLLRPSRRRPLAGAVAAWGTVLAFLAAQLAAVAHAGPVHGAGHGGCCAHVADAGPEAAHDHDEDHDHGVVADGDRAPDRDGDEGPSHGASCALCRVLALAPAVPAAPPALPCAERAPERAPRVRASFVPASVVLAADARGPPSPTDR